MWYPKLFKRLVRRLDRHVHADGWRLREIKPGKGFLARPHSFELIRTRPVRFEGPESVIAFLQELRNRDVEARLTIQLGDDYANFDNTDGWKPAVQTWMSRGRGPRNRANIGLGEFRLTMVGSAKRSKRASTKISCKPEHLEAARKICPLVDDNLRAISLGDWFSEVCLVEPVSVPDELRGRRDFYLNLRSGVIGGAIGLAGSLLIDWLGNL